MQHIDRAVVCTLGVVGPPVSHHIHDHCGMHGSAMCPAMDVLVGRPGGGQPPKGCTMDQGIQDGATTLSLTTRQGHWPSLGHSGCPGSVCAYCGLCGHGTLAWHGLWCVSCRVCVGDVAKVLYPCAVVCGVCWDRSHVVCE